MKSVISVICAVLGIGLALLDSAAGIKTIVDLVFAAANLAKETGLGDPAQLSALIGEAIIAFVTRGVAAIVPTMLICVALGPLSLREHWFYFWARLAAWSLLILFPVGTICWIVILLMVKGKKAEFPDSGAPQNNFT